MSEHQIEFVNGSPYNFVNVHEQWRTYYYPNGAFVHLIAPRQVHYHVDESHRVFCVDGISHHIAPGWVHLEWRAEEGTPHIVL